MEPQKIISLLESALAKPLPGTSAHLRMSPSVRRTVSTIYPKKDGGVLILLYPVGAKLHVVFMKRSEYDGVHSGQISFPGGMKEESDASMTETALREAEEETGVDASRVKVIGSLTPLHIPVSNIVVHPFVGYLPEKPEFRIDLREVQYLIEESLDNLSDAAIVESESMFIQNKVMEVPYFNIQGNHVWGATAMILGELLEILKTVTSDR
jgi:8-oxo-dGTP pyrophosphatase MutT (NUDIX family)